MRRAALILSLSVLALAAPRLAQAGEVGGTLGKYSVAGAGVGALLGAATATLPYLSSKEPYDFFTGAGIGMLSGAGIGFILGVVDLANPSDVAVAPGPPEGLDLAWTPQALRASYSFRF
jgi:hypothetical protein